MSGVLGRDGAGYADTPQVSFDATPLPNAASGHQDMHLICLHFRAKLAQFGKIERWGGVFDASDGENGAFARAVAADENVVCARQLGAADQGIARMGERSAAPPRPHARLTARTGNTGGDRRFGRQSIDKALSYGVFDAGQSRHQETNT